MQNDTYNVEYIIGGKKSSQAVVGNPKDIRTNFSREGKTVLKITKRMAFGATKVKTEEIVSIFKGLGNLLKMREPLSKAIDRVSSSLTKNSAMLPVLSHIKNDIEKKGYQFSRAMEPYSSIFGPMATAMVLAGDNSGRLGESLIAAAQHRKKMDGLKSSVLKKLAYPLILVVSSIVLTAFQALFVMPAMAKGKPPEANPPLLTIIMSSISSWAPFLALSIIGGCVAIFVWYKQNPRDAERWMFRIPVLKEIIFYQSYFVVFGTMSDLMEVGVHLPDALKIATKTTNLVTVKMELNKAHKALEGGKKWPAELKSLNSIERGMLEQALSDKNIVEDFRAISARYYEMYLEKIESIGPRVQVATTLFTVGVVLITVMTTIVPYFKGFGDLSPGKTATDVIKK